MTEPSAKTGLSGIRARHDAKQPNLTNRPIIIITTNRFGELKKKSHIILLAIVALSAIAAYAYPRQGGAQRQKARYYYLEGARRQAEGKMPEAYELFKKAYMADSTYAEAASAYGTNRLMVQTDSLQSFGQLRQSLGLMREFVDSYPGDMYEAQTYAFVASRLDTLSEAIRMYERIDSLRPSNTVNLLQLADAYMAAHQEDKALSSLDRFEKIEGKSPQLSLKRMGFLLAKGDTTAAVAEADALIATNPSEPSFYILKGNLYEVIGDNDSTLSAFSAAERVSPDNGSAKLALANYYKSVGDSTAYDNKLYEALLSEDFELEDKLSLLMEYLQTLLDDKSDTSRGDHLFSVLMDQYPHEPKVLDLAARYSGAKGDFADAEEQIGYAIDLDPSNIEYWGQLMRYQLAGDHAAEAMATYDKACRHVEPTEALTYLFASAATVAEDFDEAEKAYEQLIHAVNPSLPLTDSVADTKLRDKLDYEGLTHLSTLYTVLGDMYYSSGHLEKAYKAYDNSLFFFPSNPLTLNNYAYFLSEHNGDLDKAEEMSRKAIEQSPDNETYLDTYAWVLFKRKEYKEALEYQRKAMEAAEANGEIENAEFYSHLGDILFMNHEPQEALESWKKALELDPQDELLKKKVAHKTFFYE